MDILRLIKMPYVDPFRGRQHDIVKFIPLTRYVQHILNI